MRMLSKEYMGAAVMGVVLGNCTFAYISLDDPLAFRLAFVELVMLAVVWFTSHKIEGN